MVAETRPAVPYADGGVDERPDVRAVLAEVYPWARRLALMICRDVHEADDLVHDAFVAAMRNPPEPPTEDAMRAWLRVVIGRMHGRRLRSLGREMRALARLGPTRHVEHLSEETRAVVAALDRLGRTQRACVVLYYLEDMREEDVADALGIKHGTVKAHLAQARARLREILG